MGCGGAQEGGGDYSGEGESANQVVLKDAGFTTSFDNDEMQPMADTATEFSRSTGTIVFFGTLEGLPRGAQIEVQWKDTSSERPFFESRDEGSGTHTFASRFRNSGLTDGQYWAVVYVNGAKVGDAGFRITEQVSSSGLTRVKSLAVSTGVSGSNEAQGASTSFPMGVKKLYATFHVGGIKEQSTMRVIWYLEGDVVEQTDIVFEGEKRYVSTYEQRKNLARGDYAVEVDLDGEVYARRTFYVGDSMAGPTIEEATLGTALGKKQMPKKAMTVFKKKTRAIHCGIRFISAPEGAEVTVEWIGIRDGQEQSLETTRTTVKNSGPGTVSMAWKPGGTLEAGPHKASISVNGQKLQEIAFTVE
jgi:hypothetical protein